MSLRTIVIKAFLKTQSAYQVENGFYQWVAGTGISAYTEVGGGGCLGFFCFWLHHVACGILAPWPGIEPGPQWKHGVLTTGLPGNSPEVFKYTCIKEIFKNTNACCIENSVMSVNGCNAHSAMYVQKCLKMLVIKIFLRNYLPAVLSTVLYLWMKVEHVLRCMWSAKNSCNKDVSKYTFFLAALTTELYQSMEVEHISHWEKYLTPFVKKKRCF